MLLELNAPLAEQPPRAAGAAAEREAEVPGRRRRARPAGLLHDAHPIGACGEVFKTPVARRVAERAALAAVEDAVEILVDENAPARQPRLAGVAQAVAVGVVEDAAADEDFLRVAEVFRRVPAGRERDVVVRAARV